MNSLSQQLIDDIILDIINRCETIKNRCLFLTNQEFASELPKKYSILIREICEQLNLFLLNQRKVYNLAPDAVFNIILFVDEISRQLGSHLRYIDGAITTKLPWSLPLPLEKLTARFLPNTSIMLRPQWRYNYAVIVPNIVESIRTALEQILEPTVIQKLLINFSPDFHIVSFPYIERKSSLFHCDLGHEIGHLIINEFLKTESREYLVSLRTYITEEIKKQHISNPLPPLLEEIEISNELDLADDIRRRALEELGADIFGVHLLGPAALFALFSFAITNPLDKPPRSASTLYPPWRLRLDISLKHLEKIGLIPLGDTPYLFDIKEKIISNVNERIKEIRQVISEGNLKTPINTDLLTKIAYDSVFDAIQLFEIYLQTNYKNIFIKPSSLYSEVYPLIHRLHLGIIPNTIKDHSDHFEQVSLESILNAAWFFKLTELKSPFDKSDPDFDYLKIYDILNRLTLKAIELSNIQEEYEARKNINKNL